MKVKGFIMALWTSLVVVPPCWDVRAEVHNREVLRSDVASSRRTSKRRLRSMSNQTFTAPSSAPGEFDVSTTNMPTYHVSKASPTSKPSVNSTTSSLYASRDVDPGSLVHFGWSFIVPLISITIMAWAFGSSSRRCRTCCCADLLETVPTEIVVPQKASCCGYGSNYDTPKCSRSGQGRDTMVAREHDDDGSLVGESPSVIELVPMSRSREWNDPGVDPSIAHVQMRTASESEDGSRCTNYVLLAGE